jgi:hypothetical protein
MKKVVFASLLAVAGAVPVASFVHAQQPAAAAAGGQVQMSEEEYKDYTAANTAATPAAKVAAFQAYLTKYPKSAVKQDVLNQILFAASQTGDAAETLTAADNLLAVDPNNLRALTFEVYYRRADADKLTDPAAKQAGLDKAATFAEQALSAAKPAAMSDADFKELQSKTAPTFLSAIADDDLAKKDNAGAITTLKKEIDGDEPDTEKASPVLQDVYVLAQAYYTSTPPDYLNCAWYATRAATFAPDAFKPTIQPLATYCYKKYHGASDGYDAMVASVKTNLDPPAGFLDTIKPAPKPADMIAAVVASTPDLATLALGDKETALQYGTQIDPKSGTIDPATGKPDPKTQKTDADEVFDSVKGKSVEFPDVTVVSATADQLVLMVSDDANASKTPDFTVNMKEPLKTIPAPGAKITVDGTYASYTGSPLMITMSDGSVVEPKKKTPVRAPVHHTAHKPR